MDETTQYILGEAMMSLAGMGVSPDANNAGQDFDTDLQVSHGKAAMTLLCVSKSIRAAAKQAYPGVWPAGLPLRSLPAWSDSAKLRLGYAQQIHYLSRYMYQPEDMFAYRVRLIYPRIGSHAYIIAHVLAHYYKILPGVLMFATTHEQIHDMFERILSDSKNTCQAVFQIAQDIPEITFTLRNIPREQMVPGLSVVMRVSNEQLSWIESLSNGAVIEVITHCVPVYAWSPEFISDLLSPEFEKLQYGLFQYQDYLRKELVVQRGKLIRAHIIDVVINIDNIDICNEILSLWHGHTFTRHDYELILKYAENDDLDDVGFWACDIADEVLRDTAR